MTLFRVYLSPVYPAESYWPRPARPPRVAACLKKKRTRRPADEPATPGSKQAEMMASEPHQLTQPQWKTTLPAGLAGFVTELHLAAWWGHVLLHPLGVFWELLWAEDLPPKSIANPAAQFRHPDVLPKVAENGYKAVPK